MKDCCKNKVKVETLFLEDGRRAERHITVDDKGNEIIEIFAEEKKPLKLEKRIIKEKKQVVAREIHEKVRDGEIVEKEVVSREDNVPMRLVEHIGVVDHAKVVDGDYVKREEVSKMIADGVVAGVSALLENAELMAQSKVGNEKKDKVSAMQVVEKNVASKKKSDNLLNVVLGVILVAQVAFLAYMLLM